MLFRSPHGTEAEFTVNGAWEKEKLAANKRVPIEHLPHLMSKIHSHVDHFQRTHGGFGKALFFWTENKKKNSLYHHIAKDAGVPGVNLRDTEPGAWLDEEWSKKYKASIDCNHPKGFSQRAHCQGKKKRRK